MLKFTFLLLIIGLFLSSHEVSAATRWAPRSAHSQPWRTAGASSASAFSPRGSSRVMAPLEDHPNENNSRNRNNNSFVAAVARGGRQAAGNFEKTVETIIQILIALGRTVLPPTFEFARVVTAFYRTLPRDTLIAQAGLVYCFAGGYYPTLFAALSAAQNCGWDVAVKAVDDLFEEARLAIDALSKHVIQSSKSYRDAITQKTMVVLKTVDPVKINIATGALYTTWMGVSTVLQREFAKTISMSLTIADYLRPVTRTILAPPMYLCIPEDYHKWVPVVLGWACKAAAMSVAWRVQRVLTATTSAVTGGLMFSRAMMRILHQKGMRVPGVVTDKHESTPVDEFFGFCVAGVGLYSQIGRGFDFRVPFPLSLVTWPFDLAETWIQFQITKEME